MRGRVIMCCLLWLQPAMKYNSILSILWQLASSVEQSSTVLFILTYLLYGCIHAGFLFNIFDFPIAQTFAYCISNSITNEVHINAANNATTKRNWLRVVRYFNNKRHFSFPLTRRHTVSYFNFYYYCHLQFNTCFFSLSLICLMFCFCIVFALFVSLLFLLWPFCDYFSIVFGLVWFSFSLSHSTIGSHSILVDSLTSWNCIFIHNRM